MPYTHLELESHDWPFPNRYFDPAKASALYRTYVESMIYAEACGFDWVGCNEHHFSPYGLMANCNLIGGALAYPCLLYTSDAADERSSVDLGGRRIIKKKK